MIRINFLLSSQAIGCRFDRIYCSDDATIQEKNEILFPLISAAHHIQPISQLYYYAFMKDSTIRMRVGKAVPVEEDVKTRNCEEKDRM